MPFIDAVPDTTLVADGAPPQTPERPDMLTTLGAAFRQDNEVVSLYRRLNDEHFAPDPSYNPLPDIKDTPYFHTHADRFVGSHSAQETAQIKQRIDEEEADARILAASGWSGTLAQLAAGALNPTTYMVPVGGEVAGAARTAIRLGTAFGAGAAGSEAILHATHETRTAGESAQVIASATLLGGLLGSTTLARIAPAERVALENALTKDRIAMAEHAGEATSADNLRATLQPMATVEDSGDGNILVRSTGDSGDMLSLRIRPDALKIGIATVGNATRGKGVGTALYKRAVEAAAERGLPLQSDFSVSNAAARVYEKLKEQGYDVRQAPGVYRHKEGMTAPSSDGYVFEVRPPQAGTGLAQAAGAAATETRELQPVRTILGGTLDRFDPMSRLFASKSDSARRAAADLAETPLLMEQNLRNIVTTAGTPLDRTAMLVRRQAEVAAHDEVNRLYAEYRFGKADTTFPRFRAQMENFTGRDRGYMTFEQFDQEVAKAMRRGDQHDIPQVQQAAQFLRKHYDAWKDRAIGAGFFPEDVKPKGADSYLNRVYNREAVAARRNEFVDKVTDYYKADQATKAKIKDRLSWYNAQLQSWQDQIKRLEARLGRAERRSDIVGAKATERARDERPQTAGFNEPPPEGRLSELQQREATLRDEAKQLADISDLMQELSNVNPALVPLVKSTEAKIARRLGRADLLEAARQEAGRIAKGSEKRLTVLEEQLAKVENKKALLEDYLNAANDFHDAVRAKIEAELGAWEGRSASEAKTAIKAREKYIAEAKAVGGTPGEKGRLTSADAAVDRAVKRIIESDRDRPEIELRARAQETTDRILSSPDGRLAYDEYRAGPQTFREGEPPRGPLAERRFAIPDTAIEDFLEPSALHAHRAYLRTIVPDILLTERFGDTAMTEAFRKINEEYAARVAETTSEKTRSALERQRQRDIGDLAAIRDRIRGIYGFSPELPMRNAARVANAVKNYNVISLMGMSAVSSLPDMAGMVFRHGMMRSMGDAVLPFVRYLAGAGDEWKRAAKQYRAMGIATEMFSASRMHALADVTELYRPKSQTERALAWGADKFQFVSMLAPWTDWAKVNASMVAGSEILRATKAAAAGKATKRQLRQLAESNIEPAMATRIWEQFQAGGEVRNGVHLPNTSEWTDQAAREAFEGAVARDADIAVITPGQEKPLWMSQPVLSVIGQFKSFTAAATQRILLANMQRADAQTLQGLAFSLGLGMLSYKLNAVSSGKKTSDRPQDWVKEALDRGGVFGWINEGNNLAAKMTRGGVDMYRLIGADKPLSRYASRSVLDQLVGPTAGKVEAITRIGGGIASGDWKYSDTSAVRRMNAFQNVFWLRRAFDEVEAAANHRFGIDMPDRH